MFAPTDERHVTNIFNIEQHLFTQVDMKYTAQKAYLFGENLWNNVGIEYFVGLNRKSFILEAY